MAVAARRRKFWGWGYEDQQPPHEQVREAGAGLRAHLGFEPAEVERPARLEDLRLPEPRLAPPESRCGARGLWRLATSLCQYCAITLTPR